MNIAMLIGIIIAIVVGVVFIPTILSMTNGVLTNSSINSSVGSPINSSVASSLSNSSVIGSDPTGAISGLIDALPYILIGVMIIGVIAFIGQHAGGIGETVGTRIEKRSERIREKREKKIKIIEEKPSAVANNSDVNVGWSSNNGVGSEWAIPNKQDDKYSSWR